ncbi:MAG: hypothetical protein LBR16_09485 [Treponema sp.]|jgi:hypothetical protein|nr:hypothetical protein [Treponema sp.]
MLSLYKMTKTTGAALLACVCAAALSCLQAETHPQELPDYYPSLSGDRISRNFTVGTGSDMLIVTLTGGTFVSDLKLSGFEMSPAVYPVYLSRDNDTQAVLFFTAIPAGSYQLKVKEEAMLEVASRVTVSVVTGGNWTLSSLGSGVFGRSRVWGLAYGAGRYVAVGAGGKMAHSTDGIDWTAIPAGTNTVQSGFQSSIRAIAYGSDMFLAGGVDGKLGRSADGISWSGWNESLFAGNSVNAVAYGMYYGNNAQEKYGRFVAAGDKGTMICWVDNQDMQKVQDSKFGDISILALAFGGGRFVAGGSGGQLSYSTDGFNWVYSQSAKDLFAGETIYAAAYGAEKFVIAGGAGKMAYSGDGAAWTAISGSPLGSSRVLGLAFGGGVFVAAGEGGKAATSSDGITWTPVGPGVTQFAAADTIVAAAYGGGRFILAGDAAYLANEDDTKSTIVYTVQKPSEATALNPVSAAFSSAAGDNRLVIELAGGRFVDNPSIDHFTLEGTGFTNLSGGAVTRDSDTKVSITGLAASTGGTNTLTVTTAALAAPAGGVSVSADKLLAWADSTSPFGTSDVNGFAYGAGRFVAVGAGKIAHSSDGSTWTLVSDSGSQWSNASDYILFNNVVYGNNKFVAVGYWVNGGAEEGGGKAGWGAAATSSDGSTWTVSGNKVLDSAGDSINRRVYDVAFGDGRFVAVGRWAKSAWSTDGVTWNPVQIESFGTWGTDYQDINAITYGNGRFVAAGGNGKVAFSPKGETWTWVANILLGEGKSVKTLAYGNGYFIAAGDGGNMKVVPQGSLAGGSGDNGGQNWVGVDSKFDTTNILSVAWGGTRFIAVGDNGRMSESADGTVWNAIPPGTGADQNHFTSEEGIHRVFYGNSIFVAGGNAYNGNASKLVHSN